MKASIANFIPPVERSVVHQALDIATTNINTFLTEMKRLESVDCPTMETLNILSLATARLQLAAQQISTVTQVVSACQANGKIVPDGNRADPVRK